MDARKYKNMCALNGWNTQAKVLQITNLIEIQNIAMR